MFGRVLYTLRAAVSHRKALCRAVSESGTDLVTDLTPAFFSRRGIRVLALDFDGVLAPYGYAEPLPPVAKWLASMLESGCLERIYIYSNKPTEERKRHFAQRYPQVRFLESTRKKPYPDGLAEIRDQTGVPSSTVLMVDDRMLTGILAAVVAGTSGLLVRQPLANYAHAPLAEFFFHTLRVLERASIFLLRRI